MVPVPGVTIGRGHIQSNAIFVLSTTQRLQDAGSQGLSSNEAQQRKKRSTRARAVSNQDTESLPDQAMDLSPEQATEGEEKKSSADAEAVPDQATASEQPKKRGRNIRARRSPDQDMVDAVISDTEAEEEDEASDTDFVAVVKGSRKVCHAMTPPKMSSTMLYMHICMQNIAINKHQECGLGQLLVVACNCVTCAFIHSFNCSFIHSFVCWSVLHSFIHSKCVALPKVRFIQSCVCIGP
jgi:hypothetical protein